MNHSKGSICVEIRIGRASAKRALVVGGCLVLLAIGGMALASPIPNLSFSSGQTLTADELTSNFTNVEGRLAALEKAAVPVGTVLAVAVDTSNPANIPAGWLACDGGSYLRTQYPALASALGVSWGGTASAFNVPDLQGRFLRGADNGSGNDPDTASRTGGLAPTKVGSFQPHAFLDHDHGGFTGDDVIGSPPHYVWYTGGDYAVTAPGVAGTGTMTTNGTRHHHPIAMDGQSSKETRPANYAVNYIIKF